MTWSSSSSLFQLVVQPEYALRILSCIGPPYDAKNRGSLQPFATPDILISTLSTIDAGAKPDHRT